MPRFSVSQVNHVVCGMLAFILVLACSLTWVEFHSASEAREWVARTYVSIDAIQDVELRLREAEAAQQRFLVTGDVRARKAYEAALRQSENLTDTIEKIQHLDNTVSGLALAVKLLAEEWEQAIVTMPALPSTLHNEEAETGLGHIEAVAALLSGMHHREETLLSGRLDIQSRKAANIRWLVLAGAVTALLTLLWASKMLNSALRHSAESEAEQRSQALRLRVILDSLAQGVGVVGTDGRMVESNARLGELLDLQGGNQLSVVQGSGDAVGRNGIRLDMRHTRMDDGGFVLTVTDMTERRRTEKAEREVSKMQAVSHLTGGIAHDFNNLIMVILGNLEMSMKGLQTKNPLYGRMERAAGAARRGALLTSKLLAFACKQPLSPRSLLLPNIVVDFLPMLRQTVGKGYGVDYEAGNDTWPAMADPAHLESAVLDLVLNARDAMPSGGRIKIYFSNAMLDEEYVRSHSDVAPGDYVMVSVSDNGCGMVPEVASRAFEPFFSTKPLGESRGMGLSAVFGFTKQSGGHIELVSSPGKGTVAKLYLPRSAKPPVVDNLIHAVIAEVAGVTGFKKRILIAEDEPALREIAVDMLEELGYTVKSATNGEEALALFQQSPEDFDMLLTDIVMPGMDGRELSKRVLAIRPNIPILYMSGYPKDAITHGGQLDQDVRLLNKPFRGVELAAMVATMLTEARKAG